MYYVIKIIEIPIFNNHVQYTILQHNSNINPNREDVLLNKINILTF